MTGQEAVLRLRLEVPDGEAARMLQPYAEKYGKEPQRRALRTDNSCTVRLDVPDGEAARMLWPFVRKYGIPSQRQALLALLEAAGVTLPAEKVTRSSGIEALDLDITIYNPLKRAEINTIRDLIARTEADLKDIPNISTKRIGEIKTALDRHGFSLKRHP